MTRAEQQRFDQLRMGECIRLARKGRGHVSPNPLVGAVLVKDGRVIARGFHHRFGGAHAEVECLRRAGRAAAGATLYVNLEPCSHFGKTPPCADAIIRAEIGRVVIGLRDPNPLVSGRGIRKLRDAGIRVDVGILRDEALRLNRIFCTHITRRRPYVHVKIAQSVDGYIAGPPHAGRWISSPKARQLVHSLRSEYDAVLVGAGTVRADDPRLTTRLVRGRDPAAVILDGRLSAPLSSRLFATARRRRVILCTSTRSARLRGRKAEALAGLGVLVLAFDGGPLNLTLLLRRLYQLRIGSILVEGGRDVFGQFLVSGCVDEISLFLSPRILGGGIRTVGVARRWMSLFDAGQSTVKFVGDDILVNTIAGRV